MDRKMKKLGIAVLLPAMILAAALSGCSKKTANEVKTIQESGQLRVAIVDTESRYTAMEGETPVGLEPELAQYIAQALGCNVQYVVKTKQEVLAALSSGEADIALGCINASSASGGNYLVSTPYGKGNFYAVTKRGDYVLTIGSLDNSKTGVTAYLDDATRAKLYEAEGISLESYGSAKEAADAVKNGVIRAYICYESQAKELLEDPELQVQNLANLDPEEYAVVAPGNSQTLMSGINTLIRQFLEAE